MKAGIFLSTATTFLLSSLQVKAHGFVDSLVIDGKTFTSYLPFDDPYVTLNPPRVTRHIPDDGPVFDFNSPDMTCNKDAQLAKYRTTSHAPVSAGGQVSFHWQRWPSDHRGPVVTYMAQCPGNDCTNFDGKGNVWFKVDEAGLISGTTDTGVFASDLLIKNNLTWTVTVPQSLKPGAYLIRHEILALHSARAPQFYPHCTQLKVTGSGSSLPSGSELVAIPGVYKNDKSTMIDIWQNGQTSYPIGGPRNAKIAAYTGTNAVNLKNGIGKQPYVQGVVVKGSATPAGGSTGGGGANASGSGSGSGSGTPKTKKCKAKNTKRSPVPAAPAAEDKSRAVKRHVLRQQGKRRLPLQQ